MRPRLTVLVALGTLACGGGPGPGKPVPQSPQETLAQFMSAVKANDLLRMGTLWGSDRGPAADWMKGNELKERLTVIQKYLAHAGYRVVEGPLREPGHDDTQTFRVEASHRLHIRGSHGSRPHKGRRLGRERRASGEPPDAGRDVPQVSPGNVSIRSRVSYSVSSSRMPVVAFGCTNAIRRPPAPRRGTSSMRRYPAARQRSSARSRSGTR